MSTNSSSNAAQAVAHTPDDLSEYGYTEFQPGDTLHIVKGHLPGANSEDREIKIGRTQLCIAVCDSTLLTTEQNAANAAEIVRRWNAAPELLAVAQMVVDFYGGDGAETDAPMHNAAIAAIAKAKGLQHGS